MNQQGVRAGERSLTDVGYISSSLRQRSNGCSGAKPTTHPFDDMCIGIIKSHMKYITVDVWLQIHMFWSVFHVHLCYEVHVALLVGPVSLWRRNSFHMFYQCTLCIHRHISSPLSTDTRSKKSELGACIPLRIRRSLL